MRVEHGSLAALTGALSARVELGYKEDIQLAAKAFGRETRSAWFPDGGPIVNGDDATALAHGDEFLLFAAEGMRGEFVEADPWFAGFASILTNVNDIAATGGRPWAVVDVLFRGSADNARVFDGMAAASAAYGVPVVGGHTTRVAGPSMLALAVVGRAKRLITSHGARPGQLVLAAIALDGTFRGPGGNFNAATATAPERLRAQLGVLPELAERGAVASGKDISMAGLCGTLLMLLETSGCGAMLDLARIPAPKGVDTLRWLTAFPSFGFVLTVETGRATEVQSRFEAVGVACARIGEIDDSHRLELVSEGERATYWNLRQRPLTGFGKEPCSR
jgi:AIR synthase-related protein